MSRDLIVQEIWQDLCKLRAAAPLVHNITNYVVMNTTANALLALGASPVMAHAIDEVDELVAVAGALVLNIGTLSPPWIKAMVRAGQAAVRRGCPIVLDPVGVGATALRTATALRLLREAPPTIIRGNASEIRALCGENHGPKGVESRHAAAEALAAAQELSRAQGCVVSVSGEVDLIVEGDSVIRVANGHPMMPRVTGLGCTATAVTAAFAAVSPTPLRAAVHGMAIMGVAGELAGEQAAGPGSFQVAFLDALANVTPGDLEQRLRVQRQ
jgi:hydroxyethylthiazole kinase